MAVQRHHHGLAEALHVADVAVQIFQALRQSCGVGLVDMLNIHAAVHLQALCGGNDDHQPWLQTGLAALDIEEFLGTEVGTEACLRHHIVAKAHRHLRGHHTTTAVGDVGEGSAVDEGRRVLSCLHKVRVQGIPEQHRDGSCYAEVFHLEQFAIGSRAQNDILDAAL